MNECRSKLLKVKERELLLDKRSEWIDWIDQHKHDINEYRKITDVKHQRKILDIHIKDVKVDYDKNIQHHEIQIQFKLPIVNDSIEYVQKKTSPVMNMAHELGVNINELRRQARGQTL